MGAEEVHRRTRRRDRMRTAATVTIVVIAFIAIIVIAVGARVLVTGGDWSCVWSQDPVLCVQVKELGR